MTEEQRDDLLDDWTLIYRSITASELDLQTQAITAAILLLVHELRDGMIPTIDSKDIDYS